ncbi:MAG: hypothetical protein R3B70_28240 [Polyangiaceae bacterium]
MMLDYSNCGAQGEPMVVHVDEDRIPVPVAPTFAEFIDGLVDCGTLASKPTSSAAL